MSLERGPGDSQCHLQPQATGPGKKHKSSPVPTRMARHNQEPLRPKAQMTDPPTLEVPSSLEQQKKQRSQGNTQLSLFSGLRQQVTYGRFLVIILCLETFLLEKGKGN